MEPWTYEELFKVNSSLTRRLDVDELAKRYALADGIPRAVLSANVNIPKQICDAIRKLSGDELTKVLADIDKGLMTTADTEISHKVCQMVPRKGRAECALIPAGIFAARHIRAMASLSEDSGFEALFKSLGMIKNAGVFEGHTFEACVHMALEIGRSDVVTDGMLLSSNAPDFLNMWKGSRQCFSIINALYDKSELDGLLSSAPNSYWRASKSNFPAIDGIFLRRAGERACFHFLKVTTNREGKDCNVSNYSL